MKLCNILLILLLLSTGLEAKASHGGETGGGGNVCFPNGLSGTPTLLEIVGRAGVAAEPGTRIEITRKMKKIGFDHVDLTKLNILPKVEQILKRYEQTSPRSVRVLRQALAGLNFYGTALEVDQAIRADYSATPACSADNVRAAIVYSPGWAVISVPLWNRLDMTSQIGLIIHEAFRNIQIRYAGHQSDLELQQATTLTLFGNGQTNLNESTFFKEFFKDKPTQAEILAQKRESHCQDLEVFKRADRCAERMNRSAIAQYAKTMKAYCLGAEDFNIYEIAVKARNEAFGLTEALRSIDPEDPIRFDCSLSLLSANNTFVSESVSQLSVITSEMDDNGRDVMNATANLNLIPVETALHFLK